MAKTLEEWKDRYYEQQANHTEATGMLAAERDRWIQRAQKAERLIQEHNESCEAACTAQEPRCDCYTSRDLRCPDCPKDWKIETESHARDSICGWASCSCPALPNGFVQCRVHGVRTPSELQPGGGGFTGCIRGTCIHTGSCAVEARCLEAPHAGNCSEAP
jgi:hypothetical protein